MIQHGLSKCVAHQALTIGGCRVADDQLYRMQSAEDMRQVQQRESEYRIVKEAGAAARHHNERHARECRYSTSEDRRAPVTRYMLAGAYRRGHGRHYTAVSDLWGT